MVLKLYGASLSTCTRLVAAVLHEKRVPFEFVSIDFATGQHKTPEYRQHQPYGQVPYIDDDGFILYESRAISYYIASKYANQGTPLLPTELQANAIFQQATYVEIFHFYAHASKAVAEMVFKKLYRGLTPDQAVFDGHISDLGPKLDIYDQLLGRQGYLAGNEVTLVDLYHIPYGSLLPVAGSDILQSDTRPNVKRWFEQISTRPSWLAVKDGVKSQLTY